jgi:hypothetical protein
MSTTTEAQPEIDAPSQPRLPQPGLWARVSEFFYAQEVPYGLAIMRISISIALLMAMVPRWPYARELYSSDGGPSPIWTIYGHAPLFPLPSGELAVAIHSVTILALICACLGWCTRLSLIISTFGYVYLNSLDTLGTINKYSVIASHLIFVLCFSECGSIWSLDNWLRRSRLKRAGVPPAEADRPRQSAVWPRRLEQLFLGAVYFGAGLTKLKIPAYFSGEQLQTWMITSYNRPNPIGNFLEPYPSLLAIFGLIAIVWEFTFIFMAWRGVGRFVMLTVGSTFHIMTLMTLGLWLFPVVCISGYLSFLNEGDIAWLNGLFARWRERGRGVTAAVGRLFRQREWPVLPAFDPAWSYAALGLLLVATAGGGLALEYKLDRFGVRRPEGPYALKELSPDYVSRLTRPSERIRNEDKVIAFDIGSRMLAGAVLDRRSVFTQGDKMKAECDLIPPHEDLWVGCEMQDSDHRVIDTTGSSVTADSMRVVFDYSLGTSLPAGDYSLVLKIGEEEVLRRPFKLLAQHHAKRLAN